MRDTKGRFLDGNPSPFKSHGMSTSKFYRAYRSIILRCGYPSQKCYKNYGGRGIVCLWDSFDEFKKDMYESYLKHINEFGEKRTSIDRINVNGNYFKENCRWTDPKTQARNRRNTRLYDGKSLAEWAEIKGVDVRLLWNRLHKGWDFNDAINKPKCKHNF